VVEGQHTRRPDVVLFVNGLPLAVIELKNPADENATIWSAFQQLQTYQPQIPALFATNAALVVSDGVQARIGTLGAGKEWFKPWRTIAGEDPAPMRSLPSCRWCSKGCSTSAASSTCCGTSSSSRTTAVASSSRRWRATTSSTRCNVAVEETLRAARAAGAVRRQPPGRYEAGQAALRAARPGDRRVGVVWHTQGSGKSLTMAFYAGRIILHPAMANPTVVVLTDRNDLDDQLFGTFAAAGPAAAAAGAGRRPRGPAREARGGGGRGGLHHHPEVLPEEGRPPPGALDRRNIVVIADEAHRSQYDFIDGFARTCATRCPTPRSSASPARRSS
jgi:type I restriction enzyme R subunit